MRVDGKDILKRLAAAKDKRKKVSFYLTGDVYERFKKSCGKTPASQVMEELMRLFTESVRGKKF